jgi:hypothetical protein
LKEIFPEIFQGAYTPFLNLDIVPPGGGYPGGHKEDPSLIRKYCPVRKPQIQGS